MTASSVTGLPAIDSSTNIRYFSEVGIWERTGGYKHSKNRKEHVDKDCGLSGQWSTAVLGVLIPLSPITPWSVEYCSARSSHPLVSHYSLVSGVLQC